MLRGLLLPLLIALATSLCTGCGSAKLEPEQAARKFFEQIAAGHVAEAYQDVAFGLKAEQSAQAFATATKEQGLIGAKTFSFAVRSREAKVAKLDAQISRADGNLMPMVVELVEEDGTWRVFTLHAPRNERTGKVENRFSSEAQPTSFQAAARQPLPPEEAVRKLVRTTFADFARAVEEKSFTNFYRSLAGLAQARVTKASMERSFSSFLEHQQSVQGLDRMDFAFTEPPSINSDGWLVARGRFPTSPIVAFTLKYVYELPDWKLMDVNVQLISEQAPVTAPTQ